MSPKESKNKKTPENDNGKKTKELEKLNKQIEELTKEKDDTFEKLQRMSADYANHQKRTPKLISDSVAYEKKSIILSLLPSLDNLALALANSTAATETEAGEGFVKGVQLVYDHMLDALKAHSVEQIESLGKEFDPAMHEAVMRRSEEDKPNNIVLEEFQTGFKLNGQVIRPCKVIVNMIQTEQPSQEDAGTDKDENKQAGDTEGKK